MQQVGSPQRGMQPLNLPPNSRQGMRTNALRLSGSAKGPQFGLKIAPSAQFLSGLWDRILRSLANKLVPIFQKITEIYIAGFVAQDMVGMFGSRVPTALAVGRDEPLDPSQDPKLRDKPFSQQIRGWLVGNIKSLNWINFKEEFWREVLTGPGLLLGPALIFIVARRLFGKTGAEMPAGRLSTFTKSFQDYLKAEKLDKAADISEAAYQKAVKGHLIQLLDVGNESLSRKTGDKTVKHAEVLMKSEKLITEKSPKELVALAEKWELGPKATYKDALDAWADKWSQTIVFGKVETRAERGIRNEAKKTLSNDLKNLLVGFNRKYRLNPYVIANQVQEGSLVHRSQHTWVKLQGRPEHVSIDSLTADLGRWSDVVKTAWEQKGKKWAQHAMPDVLEAVKERLMAKKFYLALGTTLATAAYLFRLVFFTQSHDAYAATRLLHEQPGNDAKKSDEAGAPQFGSRRSHRSCSNAETPFKAFTPAVSTFNPVRPPVFSSQANMTAERTMP